MKFDLDVLVVGSLHLDIVVRAQALPVLDETARGSAWSMVCGGKGGNQACWAARLGAKTAMISQIGDDDFGKRLLANLKSCGVKTQGIMKDRRAGSGMSVAIVNRQGDYGAVIVSGANLTMNKAQVLRHVQNPRIVLLQNEIDEAINIAVARAAKKRGAFVILNAAPARNLPKSLAENVDLLIVNRVEATMLSGHKVEDATGARKALGVLQKHIPKVIVTLGGKGAVVADDYGAPHFIKALKVKVRSTHGAGDCYVASLAKALAQGATLMQAAEEANAVAAKFVSGRLKG